MTSTPPVLVSQPVGPLRTRGELALASVAPSGISYTKLRRMTTGSRMSVEEARRLVHLEMKERSLQEQLRREAQIRGWRHYHTWNSQHSPAGFPDSVLVRGDRLIFAELKRESEALTDKQREWLGSLIDQGTCEVYVLRPSGWDVMKAALA